MGATLSYLLVGIAAAAASPPVAAVAAAIVVGVLFHIYANVGNDVMNLPFDHNDRGRGAAPLVRGTATPQAALFLALIQLGPMFLVVGAVTIDAEPPLAWAIILIAAYNLAGKAIPVPFFTDFVQGEFPPLSRRLLNLVHWDQRRELRWWHHASTRWSCRSERCGCGAPSSPAGRSRAWPVSWACTPRHCATGSVRTRPTAASGMTG